MGQFSIPSPPSFKAEKFCGCSESEDNTNYTEAVPVHVTSPARGILSERQLNLRDIYTYLDHFAFITLMSESGNGTAIRANDLPRVVEADVRFCCASTGRSQLLAIIRRER